MYGLGCRRTGDVEKEAIGNKRTTTTTDTPHTVSLNCASIIQAFCVWVFISPFRTTIKNEKLAELWLLSC